MYMPNTSSVFYFVAVLIKNKLANEKYSRTELVTLKREDPLGCPNQADISGNTYNLGGCTYFIRNHQDPENQTMIASWIKNMLLQTFIQHIRNE
jgi:hypothetical protein